LQIEKLINKSNTKQKMKTTESLLENNKVWAENVKMKEPDFFKNLADAQTPEFLWIGCSDSRVPPDRITSTKPGEIFIHRNIANMVVHTDMNMLSVLEYSVNVLKVNHIIVCGHYGCGGVKAAMTNTSVGLINKWLRNIKDVYKVNAITLEDIPDESVRLNHLIELNIKQQVLNLSETSIVQKAWQDRKSPVLHGWVYDLNDGIIKELFKMDSIEQVDPIYRYDNL
jgi:carbonic anhydrase